jgi:hypothetical protein
LRNATTSSIDAQRLVALIYSDQTAQAVRTIETMADDMGPSWGYDDDTGPPTHPMDYTELMQAVQRWQTTGHHTTQLGGQSWQDNFNAKLFWPAFTLVTGEKPRAEHWQWDKGEHSIDPTPSIFSCSC